VWQVAGFRDAGDAGGIVHGSLHDRFVQVMAVQVPVRSLR